MLNGGVMLKKIARRLRRELFPSDIELMANRWFADNGDKTLRLNYDLDKTSIIFDLGGYEGQWVSDIHAMYRCPVYVFEPVKSFADAIQNRFVRNPDIHVFQFGLAGKTREEFLAVSADGSSLFGDSGEKERIRLVEIGQFFANEGIKRIDLMKINIEGGEYELLECILDSGLIDRIDNIQVQFHACIPEAKVRMTAIQKRLALTHELTWQYEFIWENWCCKRKS